MADLTIELNTVGMRCPMPLLKTKQALANMHNGQVLRVIASDSGSKQDIPDFLTLAGHKLLSIKEQDSDIIFLIEKRS